MRQFALIIILASGLSLFCQTSWTLSNSGIPAGYSPNDFALAGNGDVYLAACVYTNSAFSPKLFVSTDNGGTWTQISMSGVTNTLLPNTIIFSGTKLLMAGSGGGNSYVYASVNNGQNWTLSNSGIPNGYNPTDFALASNGDIYLSASIYSVSAFIPKLLKSTNSGTSWTEVFMNGLTNMQNTNSLIFSGSTLLLSGSNSGTSSYYVYSSTDNGLNWTLSNSGIPNGYSLNDFAITPTQEIFAASSIFNSPSFTPKIVKSTNGGASWTDVTGLTGLTNLQNTNSIIFCNNSFLLSGSNSSNASYFVFKSTLPVAAPSVSTSPVLNITSISAEGIGNANYDGGTSITSRGICWGTSSGPTIADQISNAGNGTGTFTASLSGLQPLTTYYVRAFATNSVGTSYGNEVNFITSLANGLQVNAIAILSNLYPVPAEDIIYVQLNDNPMRYTINDATGKEVLRGYLTKENYSIDISNLSKGIYLLKSEKGQKLKIIKN
jgi:hypothetical protein